VSYLVDDVAHFVMGAPYLTLARPRSAIAFLERVLRLRSECFTGLETYPALQVEPLEFFYLTARSLGMLDAASLEVMTTKLTWRGVVWGGHQLDPHVAVDHVRAVAAQRQRPIVAARAGAQVEDVAVAGAGEAAVGDLAAVEADVLVRADAGGGDHLAGDHAGHDRPGHAGDGERAQVVDRQLGQRAQPHAEHQARPR
jgi:hypothetical protein